MELYILALLTLALAFSTAMLVRHLLTLKDAHKSEIENLQLNHALEIKTLFKDSESAKMNLISAFQAEREKYIDAIFRKESGQPVFGERNKPAPPREAETNIDRKMRIKRERDEPQLGKQAEAAILEGIKL